MKRGALIAAFLVAACGSFGVAQPHTLSLAYKAGDTYKYKFHSTAKQAATMEAMSVPFDIEMSASESVKVNSVDSSGTADLTITLSDFTVKSVTGGITNTTTGIPMNSIDVKIAADGTIADIGGNPVAASNPFAAFSGIGGGFFVTAVLPSKAVKPGDKWSKTYDQANPYGSGGVHVTTDSTYLRDESFNGVTAAVVETKSSGTIDFSGPSSTTKNMMSGLSMKGSFTSDVTTWIDPSGHRIMKSHSTSTDDATIELPSASSDQTGPMMTGPITAKGEATTDLTPA
jgi:hypothetical protein